MMSTPQSNSNDDHYSASQRRRSTSARRDYHSRAFQQSAKSPGRNICVAVTTVGAVLAIGGGFAIGFFMYPYMTNASEEPTENELNLQYDNDTGDEMILDDGEPARMNDVPVALDSLNCGKPAVPLQRILQLAKSRPTDYNTQYSRSKRIVGGDASTLRSFPWQVSLWTGNHHTCGGSFISSNWVITAAHCTEPYPNPENWTVYAGANTIGEMARRTNETQIFRLSDVVTHGGFDSTTYHNDVALMRTISHFDMNDRVSPICLPQSDEKVEVGQECLISGWGALAEGGDMPQVLQQAAVTIIDLFVCNKDDWLMNLVKDSMICAGTENGIMDACQGDSGGPLSCIRKSSGQFYLPGLVSWGIGCGEPRMPGVYTRLANYKTWIIRTIQTVEEKYS